MLRDSDSSISIKNQVHRRQKLSAFCVNLCILPDKFLSPNISDVQGFLDWWPMHHMCTETNIFYKSLKNVKIEYYVEVSLKM